MRTKTLLFAAVLSVAAIATSKAQVTSVNYVGYVNMDLVAGLNLKTNPLSTGSNQLSEVLPNVEIATSVFLFNGAGYDQSDFIAGWVPDATWEVGAGAFIESPGAQTVTLVGEGLLGDASNTTVSAGLNLLGSKVPQAGLITTDLNFQADAGDSVFKWNGAGYDQFDNLGGLWVPEEPTLDVGEAVFIDAAGERTWNRDFSIE